MYCMQCFLKSKHIKSRTFNDKNRWNIKKVMVLKKLLPYIATRDTYSPGDWRCDEVWREQTLVYPQWCASRGWFTAHENWTSWWAIRRRCRQYLFHCRGTQINEAMAIIKFDLFLTWWLRFLVMIAGFTLQIPWDMIAKQPNKNKKNENSQTGGYLPRFGKLVVSTIHSDGDGKHKI